jgi:hypothetical protein
MPQWSHGESKPETTGLPSIFVISPIGEDGTDVRRAADQVLKHIVRKALPEGSFVVERADEDKQPGAITPRIISKIIEADVVIADLSGYNPNVFYELAVAHGYVRPVVYLQRQDEKVAFDVKDMRIIRYSLSDPDRLEIAVTELRAQVDAAIENPSAIETPLTAAGKFKALDTSIDPQAEVAERLTRIEAALERRSSVRVQMAPIRVASDTLSVAEWIDSQLAKRDFGEDEVRTLITPDTSKWFDEWVEGLIERHAMTQDAEPANADVDPWARAENDPWTMTTKEEPPF